MKSKMKYKTMVSLCLSAAGRPISISIEGPVFATTASLESIVSTTTDTDTGQFTLFQPVPANPR